MGVGDDGGEVMRGLHWEEGLRWDLCSWRTFLVLFCKDTNGVSFIAVLPPVHAEFFCKSKA